MDEWCVDGALADALGALPDDALPGVDGCAGMASNSRSQGGARAGAAPTKPTLDLIWDTVEEREGGAGAGKPRPVVEQVGCNPVPPPVGTQRLLAGGHRPPIQRNPERE